MKHAVMATAAGLSVMLLIAAAAAQQQRAASRSNVPQWIQTEKVRAIYLNQWDKDDLPPMLAEDGFNTLHVQFTHGTRHYAQWVRLAKENNLRLFAGVWWDYPMYVESRNGRENFARIGTRYRAFVNREGKANPNAVCPLDQRYWDDWIIPTPVEMAKLSLEDGVLEGIILDTELYARTGGSFYRDLGACVCDSCFENFLRHSPFNVRLANMPAEQRWEWLGERNVRQQYNERLRDNVTVQARRLQQAVHAVNPRLLLGFTNWYGGITGDEPLTGSNRESYFLPGILHGLKTPRRPVMVWSEYPEYQRGFGHYTRRRAAFFESVGDVIYLPGLWMAKHEPDTLPRQMFDLATHSDGYWIWVGTADKPKLYEPSLREQFKKGNQRIITR